jgi:hypothetical protein
LSTAKLQVVGSGHSARFGEDFDEVLARVLNACHDHDVAAVQLDELGLLTVLAQYAAAGHWDPDAPVAVGGAELHADVIPSDLDPAVRFHRYAIFHQPGPVIDVVTFEGYTLQPDQTVVRTAQVATVIPEG